MSLRLVLPGRADGGRVAEEGVAVAGQPAIYGDAAYGSGELLERLEGAGSYNGIKMPAAGFALLAAAVNLARLRFFTTFGSRTCMREVMPSLAA